MILNKQKEKKMNYKKNTVLIIFAIMVVIVSTANAAIAGGIMIITNKNIPENSLTKAEIKKIYSGDITQWSDHSTIILTVHGDSDLHKNFLKEYVKKTPMQFKRTWRNLLFSGKGKMPKKVDSFEALVDYVSKNDGAIGYVTQDVVTDNVRAIPLD
jgi:ABC-type phosphate transport system substrate-binding protein